MKKTTKKYSRVFWKVFKFTLIFFILIGFLGGGLAIGMVAASLRDLPEFNRDRLENPSIPTIIVDRDGNFIGEAYAEKRIIHSFDEFPQDLINAFLATEDRNFFEHPGFDIRGIGRAVMTNLRSDNLVGGSTITQQLAKQVFLHQGKVLDRKIQELYLALKIEKYYTKEEILEFYLNSAVHYGRNEFGVGAAARALFGKNLDELTLAETALLAGIPNWPARFDPRIGSREDAIRRRNYVLSRMYNEGFITKEQYDEAINEELVLAGERIDDDNDRYTNIRHFGPYEYALREAQKILAELYGYNEQEARHAVYNHGFTIRTTINTQYQQIAENVINDDSNFRNPYKGEKQQEEASAVLIDNKTGEILALVPGRNAHPTTNALLRPIDSFRSPGSTIKPIIAYAPLIENRTLFPGSVLDDSPVIYPGNPPYTPENYSRDFQGLVTVREALYNSYNIPAVKALDKYGLRNGLTFAQKFGLSQYDPNKTGRGLSAAIGGVSVTNLELTSAYTAFANNGVLVEPTIIKEIIDRNGRVVFTSNPSSSVVVSEETAFLITDMLKDVITTGTGTGVRSFFTKTAAAKTGTSNNNQDRWIVGYTPHYTLGIWVGWDDNKPLDNTTITRNITRNLWGKIMDGVHKDIPNTSFKEPNNIVPVAVSTKSGKLPSPLTPSEFIKTDYFIRGFEPTEMCDAFVEVTICRVSGKLASDSCPPHHRQTKVMLAPRDYLVTTSEWTAGAGRKPKDVNMMAPTEVCDIHQSNSNTPNPRNLTAELTAQGIRLKWDAPSDLLGFNIYRKTPDSAFTLVNEVPINVKEFLDTEVKKDVEYSYYVTALTGDGIETRGSNTIQVTLPSTVQRVTNFKLEFRNNRVEISWDPTLNATNYLIYRSTDETSDFTKIHSTSNLFYLDTDIERGKTYYYYIVAEGASPSPTKSIKIPKNNGNDNENN